MRKNVEELKLFRKVVGTNKEFVNEHTDCFLDQSVGAAKSNQRIALGKIREKVIMDPDFLKCLEEDDQ